MPEEKEGAQQGAQNQGDGQGGEPQGDQVRSKKGVILVYDDGTERTITAEEYQRMEDENAALRERTKNYDQMAKVFGDQTNVVGDMRKKMAEMEERLNRSQDPQNNDDFLDDDDQDALVREIRSMRKEISDIKASSAKANSPETIDTAVTIMKIDQVVDGDPVLRGMDINRARNQVSDAAAWAQNQNVIAGHERYRTPQEAWSAYKDYLSGKDPNAGGNGNQGQPQGGGSDKVKRIIKEIREGGEAVSGGGGSLSGKDPIEVVLGLKSQKDRAKYLADLMEKDPAAYNQLMADTAGPDDGHQVGTFDGRFPK